MSNICGWFLKPKFPFCDPTSSLPLSNRRAGRCCEIADLMYTPSNSNNVKKNWGLSLNPDIGFLALCFTSTQYLHRCSPITVEGFLTSRRSGKNLLALVLFWTKERMRTMPNMITKTKAFQPLLSVASTLNGSISTWLDDLQFRASCGQKWNWVTSTDLLWDWLFVTRIINNREQRKGKVTFRSLRTAEIIVAFHLPRRISLFLHLDFVLSNLCTLIDNFTIWQPLNESWSNVELYYRLWISVYL